MKLALRTGIVVILVVIGAITGERAIGDGVSFLVDPSTIDTNMNGFIDGTEFSPVGTDGTVFTFEPVNNLVGFPRFLLSDTNGLQFGGGGGSTLEFAFSVNRNIQLETYTIPNPNLILGNPQFDITEGITILSSVNDSDVAGTFGFNDGPIELTAGTIYTFDVTTAGAAVQSFQSGWTYTATAVPEPGTAGLTCLVGCALYTRRRRS